MEALYALIPDLFLTADVRCTGSWNKGQLCVSVVAGTALAQGSTRQEHGCESHTEHVRLDAYLTPRVM